MGTMRSNVKLFIVTMVLLWTNTVWATGPNCITAGSTVTRYLQTLNSSGVATQATSKTARIYDVNDTTTPSATVADGSFTEFDGTPRVGLYRYSFTAPSTVGTGIISLQATVSATVYQGEIEIEIRNADECG